MKKVTIHQPDFMPWLGFFNKINKADLFVVLNHTENNPRDSSFWGRRVKIISNKKEHWLSIPLIKPAKGVVGQPINEMKINLDQKRHFKKNITLIYQNYSKTPYFKEIFPIIENYFNSEEEHLSIRNMEFIEIIMDKLNIKTKIIYSASLSCEKKSSELLLEILNKTRGTTYLCGDGASGYQKDELFIKAGIGLEYNNFKQPIYNQINTESFISGLSIIDSLMNIGFNGVEKLLNT